MWTATSDEQVAERAVAGDRDAFGELVLRWEGRIYRLAYGMLGCAEEARDATQETFFAAYRNLGNFRGDAQVSSWLHRIAVNQCISRQRRSKTRSETSLPESDEMSLDEQLWAQDAPHLSPAARTEQSERAAAVQSAVAALPADLREIVVLKEFEEMTFQQITDHLGVPLSTVKSRLYTALKQLRLKLEKFEAEVVSK